MLRTYQGICSHVNGHIHACTSIITNYGAVSSVRKCRPTPLDRRRTAACRRLSSRLWARPESCIGVGFVLTDRSPGAGRTMGGPDAHQRRRCDGCLRHAGAIRERYDNSNMYSSVSQVVPVATVFTTSIRLIVCSHLFGMVVRPRSIAGARQRATGYRGVCVPGRNPASMLVLCLELPH